MADVGDMTSSSFNPLVIGACLRTRSWVRRGDGGLGRFQSPRHRGMSSDLMGGLAAERVRLVSIPSSSGHVFGPAARRAVPRVRPRDSSFNPLVIGACLRTRPRRWPMRTSWPMFQSPRHRGMSSDRARATAGRQAEWCFNPLVIGACLRTRRQQDRPAGPWLVSIPSSSGHVFGRSCQSTRTSAPSRVSIPSSSGHVFGLAKGL